MLSLIVAGVVVVHVVVRDAGLPGRRLIDGLAWTGVGVLPAVAVAASGGIRLRRQIPPGVEDGASDEPAFRTTSARTTAAAAMSVIVFDLIVVFAIFS